MRKHEQQREHRLRLERCERSGKPLDDCHGPCCRTRMNRCVPSSLPSPWKGEAFYRSLAEQGSNAGHL